MYSWLLMQIILLIVLITAVKLIAHFYKVKMRIISVICGWIVGMLAQLILLSPF